jgi:large conductance mechanosensitive channel
MSLLQEFKTFAMRGNVVDMAVGVIIGGAFGKIVSSFVNDVVMPPIGLVTGGTDFTDKIVVLKEAVVDAAGNETAKAVTVNYGNFLQVTLDFVLIAMAVFAMVRVMNSLKKKEEAKPAAPAAPPRQEVLLGEIRDLLAKKG